MKQAMQSPRLPRTIPSMLASHRSLLTEARESRLLGWRREAAYYLRSAGIERMCIASKAASK
ncbi:hypothetical protein DR73_2266 [Enterobacteriaceae bacterium ATCC 29904]|nr:hypothetical protein DR73_2266 [Enterobacteriaceae bacterium ATCC 29904]